MPCKCEKPTPCPECFIAAARAYLGVQWVHQGRSRNGVDCVGLLVCAAKDAGIIVEDVRNYSTRPDGERFAALLHQYCVKIEPAQMADGDLLAVKYKDQPQHLMIVTRTTQWGPFVIHAFGTPATGGSVIEHLLDNRWFASHKAQLYAVFRVKAFVSA